MFASHKGFQLVGNTHGDPCLLRTTKRSSINFMPDYKPRLLKKAPTDRALTSLPKVLMYVHTPLGHSDTRLGY